MIPHRRYHHAHHCIFVSENSFADLSLTVGTAVITYGNFIQAVLNFLIMALVVFLLRSWVSTAFLIAKGRGARRPWHLLVLSEEKV